MRKCALACALVSALAGCSGEGQSGFSQGSGGSGGQTMSQAGGASGGSAGSAAGGAGGGQGGVSGSAGSDGSAGKAGGGAGGMSGASGSGGMTSLYPQPVVCDPWPEATGTEELSATFEVSGVFDGQFTRYVGVGALGSDTQSEDLPPIFHLAEGAVLKNVIIGKPASDGVHCAGNCYLQNVWWEDVGEDAATLDAGGEDADPLMTIECAGARHAADKVFQHNGPGTMLLTSIFVEDFNKLYRSCGNCLEQFQRDARLENIEARDGSVIAGVNENYDDVVQFENIGVDGNIDICWLYEGNDTDAEPNLLDMSGDAPHCLYESSDIHDL